MISTLAAAAPSRTPSACRRPRRRCPARGVRMHQRPSNSSAKPASGPDCSVPAIGWPGMKCTPAGTCGATSRTTARLHRADVGQDGAGLQMRRDLRGERPAGADRHAEDDEIGALHRLGGAVVALVDEAELQRRVERLPACARCRRSRLARPLRAHGVADRRADQADADQRHALEHRLRSCRPPSEEVGERRDHRAVVGLGADGHAQAVGQAVAGDVAHDDAARLQELVGRVGAACASPLGKWTSTKLATLGVTLRPSLLDLGR